MARLEGVPRQAEVNAVKRAQVKVKAHTRKAPAPKGKLFAETVSAPAGGEKLVGRKRYAKSQQKVNRERQAPLHLTAEGKKLAKKGYYPNIKQVKKAQGGILESVQHTPAVVAPHLPTKGPAGFVGNVAKGALEIPAQSPTSLVLTGKSLVEHPKETVKQLAKTTAKQLTPKGFYENPVGTLLIARGGEAALSRAAGKGSKLAGSERPDLKLMGNASVERRYSKGLVEAKVQKAADTRAVKQGRGTTVRREARDEQGNLKLVLKKPAIQATQKQMLGAKAGRVGLPASGHLNRRTDQEVGTNSGMLRIRRAAMFEHAKGWLDTHGQDAADAAPLFSEGVVKRPETAVRDLTSHLADLKREREHLTDKADIALNEQNTRHLEGLLKRKDLPRVMAGAEAVAQEYQRVHAPLEAERVKHGDLVSKQAIRRPLLPFAVREMGLRFNESKGRFEDAAGNRVADEQIVQEFKARGGKPENLSYVPQHMERVGSASFRGGSGSQLRRPGAESKRFKGSASLTGAYLRDFSTLADQLAHASTRVERHRGINHLVNLFGVRQKNGDYFDTESAWRERQNQLQSDTGQEWTALTVARKSAPESLMEQLNPSELEGQFTATTPSDKHVVLFPKAVAERLLAHEGVRDRSLQGLQTATQYFRHAILPTSPRWLAGNVIEALFRSAINDPTILRSILTGHRLESELKTMGPKGQEALQRLQAGAASGHFGSQKRLDFHNPNEGFAMRLVHEFRQANLGQVVDKLTNGKAPGGAVLSEVGPKGIGDMWDKYKQGVFALNERMEATVYWAALGKEAQREVQSFRGSWLKTLDHGGDAYRDVARGLLDSNNVARYVRAVDEMRGRYTNLSPAGRAMVTRYTPFAPWYVNALYFAFVTLPVRHPVKTALLAIASANSDEQRQKLGFTLFPKAGTKQAFSNVMGGVPSGAGKAIPAARYLPFGAFSDPLQSVATLALPQFNSFFMNLTGENFAGNPLKVGKLQGDQVPIGTRVKIALNTLAESFVPFLRQGRQLREKGGTSLDTSTFANPQTKPGTQTGVKGGANKAFNPFRSYSTGNSSSTQDLDAVLKAHGLGGGTPSVDQVLKNAAGSGGGPSVDQVLQAAGMK